MELATLKHFQKTLKLQNLAAGKIMLVVAEPTNPETPQTQKAAGKTAQNHSLKVKGQWLQLVA